MRRSVPVLVVLALGAAAWWVLARGVLPGPGAASSRRTIVLVTIDTWRRDRCGAYGARPSPTPRIDRFAEGALVVEDARSPVPLTLPSHTTMLTGLAPARHGVRSNAAGRIPPPASRKDEPLLAERLREAGWRTGAFVSAAPLAARYGLDQGFERYDDEGVDDRTGLAYARRPGTETVDRALSWLASVPAEDRAFLFVHLFEPHAPYPRGYEANVTAADEAFGRLLDGLALAGRGDAAILLTSDHGEALGDLGEPTHGLLLGDAVLRVPMIATGTPGRMEGPVDLADVAPTLAGWAGIGWPTPGVRVGSGVDVFAAPLPRDRIRVAESFYAHQRFRWAQVVAAVTPDGRTLLDVGAGRAFRLPPALEGEPQGLPAPVRAADPWVRAPAEALAEYKRSERPERITAGSAAGGYSQTGRAEPFLSGEENARLPDPYDRMPASVALDLLLAQLRADVPSPRVARKLEEMLERDEANPELWFWLGEARKTQDPAGAEKAYLESWKRGRREPSTLYLLIGVDAKGREQAQLDRLRELVKEVGWAPSLHGLEARLLDALGRKDEACASLAKGEAASRTSGERERLRAIAVKLGCR